MSITELLFSLELGMIFGIVAIGVYLTFRVINFSDLTCDGSFVLGAAVSSILLKSGFNPVLALLMAVVAGVIAGLCTSFLNIYFKVTAILSGILVGFMLYSINLKVMQGVPNLTLINEITIFSGRNPLLILAIVSLIVWFLVSYFLVTNVGLALRSTGQNSLLSTTNGVKIEYMTMTGLALGNACVALGGALFSQHQGFVDISQGVGTIITGLAAVMLGEKLLPFRSPWIMIAACFVGSFLYRLLVSYALHSEILGLSTQDLNLITGALIVLVMIIPTRKIQTC
jgi:putative ABC transport system permease protein